MYADCIEQTLSGNSIVPRGRFVKFDVEDFLSENSMAEIEVEEPASARVREDENA
jgi:hypothetical protein